MANRRKLSQPTLTLKSLHLPLDLVAEILCRLSVKHLLQLRCICKSWNSLITQDSIFAQKHFRLSTSIHNRHHLIQTPNHSSSEFILLHSSISSIFSSTFTTTTLIKEAYGNIASTCDGIVCFKKNNSSAILFNPSIRKFKILPPLTFFSGQRFVEILYTLVHDRFTNNYKVIAVNSHSRKNEVHVHTLGTDYWRRIQDYPGPHLICMFNSGIFLSDSVNWLTHAQYIVSLDLEKESYQKLSLPAFDVHSTISYITLETLRGCLSLLYRRDKFCDVWILKEHGNEKSWIKLLSVPLIECDFLGYIKALYISKDDQVLMECFTGKYRLIVFDSINNTFMIPKFQYGYEGEMTPEVYVESLISP